MNTKTKTNKDIIEDKVKKLGYKIGCYDDNIDKISKKELKKILDALEEEYTDIRIKVRKKEFVVEIATVDNEKDFNMKTLEEYIYLYGDEILED